MKRVGGGEKRTYTPTYLNGKECEGPRGCQGGWLFPLCVCVCVRMRVAALVLTPSQRQIGEGAIMIQRRHSLRQRRLPLSYLGSAGLCMDARLPFDTILSLSIVCRCYLYLSVASLPTLDDGNHCHRGKLHNKGRR